MHAQAPPTNTQATSCKNWIVFAPLESVGRSRTGRSLVALRGMARSNISSHGNVCAVPPKTCERSQFSLPGIAAGFGATLGNFSLFTNLKNMSTRSHGVRGPFHTKSHRVSAHPCLSNMLGRFDVNLDKVLCSTAPARTGVGPLRPYTCLLKVVIAIQALTRRGVPASRLTP